MHVIFDSLLTVIIEVGFEKVQDAVVPHDVLGVHVLDQLLLLTLGRGFIGTLPLVLVGFNGVFDALLVVAVAVATLPVLHADVLGVDTFGVHVEDTLHIDVRNCN